MIFGSFTETTGNNTTPQEKQHTVGERSERASAASEASGAIQMFECIIFRIFREFTETAEKNTTSQEKRK